MDKSDREVPADLHRSRLRDPPAPERRQGSRDPTRIYEEFAPNRPPTSPVRAGGTGSPGRGSSRPTRRRCSSRWSTRSSRPGFATWSRGYSASGPPFPPKCTPQGRSEREGRLASGRQVLGDVRAPNVWLSLSRAVMSPRAWTSSRSGSTSSPQPASTKVTSTTR